MGTLILYLKQISKNKITIYIILISGIIATLYKDTNLPLMLSIIILYYLFERFIFLNKLHNIIRLFITLLLIVTFALFLNFSYNYIKYENIFPIQYIGIVKVGPDALRSLKYFIATIFSPNGGVLVFWSFPLFINLLAFKVCNIYYLKSAVLISSLLILISISGFSFWTGTFGWASWGNRYIIPTFLAVIVCFVLTSNFKSGINFFQKPLLITLITILAAISFIYLFISYASKDKAEIFALSLDAGDQCKAMVAKMNSSEYRSMQFKDWYRSQEFVGCENERFISNPLFLFK